LPRDVNFALFFRCDLGESSNGKINRVPVDTGRAVICDSNNDALAVLRVGNADLFTTETGLFARVAVSVLVNGGDHVVVGVDGSTSTCNTILSEEGGDTVGERLASTGTGGGRS